MCACKLCVIVMYVCRPPMHQYEVAPTTENTEGSSLHLENKGAGEDVSSASDVAAAAAASTISGTLLVLPFSACISFNTALAVQLQSYYVFTSCRWMMRCWCGCLSGARCRWSAFGPANATVNHIVCCFIKVLNGLSFSCWLAQVVVEKSKIKYCCFVPVEENSCIFSIIGPVRALGR